jgi:hypothetical protein
MPKTAMVWSADRQRAVALTHLPADGPTAIVEMLFCTSLVALVGAADNKSSSASPRRLQIVNTKVSLDLAGPHYSEIVLNCDKRLAPSP